MIATALDRALRAAGIPIDGVSVGRPDDRKTWVVQFAEWASKADQQRAQDILEAFDPVAEAAKPKPKSDSERLAALEAEVAALKAARAPSK